MTAKVLRMPTKEDDEECASYEDCETCTKSLKCGWCIQEDKCVRGDNISPLYGICNFYDFQYCSGKSCSRFVDCEVNYYNNKIFRAV